MRFMWYLSVTVVTCCVSGCGQVESTTTGAPTDSVSDESVNSVGITWELKQVNGEAVSASQPLIPRDCPLSLMLTAKIDDPRVTERIGRRQTSCVAAIMIGKFTLQSTTNVAFTRQPRDTFDVTVHLSAIQDPDDSLKGRDVRIELTLPGIGRICEIAAVIN